AEMHAADAAIITKNGRSSARVHRGNTSTAPSCQLRPVNRGVQLLVLDDWGTHTLNDRQRLDLLEIFEERYRRKSTLITAQLPVAAWHEMIGEATLADAILDRIVHNAHRITLEGDSMRKRKTPTLLTGDEITEHNHA
ncbi:ATP-binding protein, partial [Agrobacterium vitis]|uniref:ATP-binding protein n=1 Tax=Agrobacterium vitis TaxID=373 RepID=UPI001F45ED9E